MQVKRREELPEKYRCKKCGSEKPISEMLLVRHRRSGEFYLRPRCKECHNKTERGHRREYKRKYLKLWRKRNPEINEGYWRQRNADNRKELTAQSYARFKRNHAAILIQGRLRRRMGMLVDLAEAKRLARKYGPCYPTRYGLTAKGIKECERIRSRMRRDRETPDPVEIRMMVYEDGFYITPVRQKMPYRKAAARLSSWHAQRKTQITEVVR
jgi:hypothetical protein